MYYKFMDWADMWISYHGDTAKSWLVLFVLCLILGAGLVHVYKKLREETRKILIAERDIKNPKIKPLASTTGKRR